MALFYQAFFGLCQARRNDLKKIGDEQDRLASRLGHKRISLTAHFVWRLSASIFMSSVFNTQKRSVLGVAVGLVCY
jgi:hypothetical protein